MTKCRRVCVVWLVYQRLGGQSTMTITDAQQLSDTVYQRLGGQSTMTSYTVGTLDETVYQRLGGQSTMT